MKKTLFLLTSLFLTVIMQAQDRPQPKPGPAPAIKFGTTKTFELKNGLKVIVVENNKLPRVSYNLTIDNAPYAEGDKKGVSDLASSLIGNETKNMSKEAFNEEIDFLGANISFDASGAYASGLSKYSKRILELMADGALNSVFTQEEFDKEKAKIIEGLKSDEKSVSSAARRVERVLAYGKNHYNGEYTSEETLKNVSLRDVKINYEQYFVPQNAYLIVVGDVKFNDVKKNIEKLFGSWKKATAPTVTYNDPKDVQYTQINFVDMPNAVQSEISLLNISNLKMTDKDYFATLVANQILGGDFNSYLNMNLREAHGWTYGARSSIRGSKYTGTFSASSQVRNAVTDSAVVEFLKEIKRIRTEKVTAEELTNVKAGYIGNFVMQVEKPSSVARYALQTRTQNLPADFYENYIKNINAVTADDILRVANKYFKEDNLRIVIVGKAADVLSGLEKLNIPLFYFDKYGNPTEKPVINKPIPAGVTVKSIAEKYITAIGGEKNIATVKTTATKANGTIQGMPLVLEMKRATGKLLVNVSVMGNVMSKQVVSDKGAYVEAQGQKQEITGKDFEEMKDEAIIFPELTLAKKAGVTLTGIESINGSDAYAIKDGSKTTYYDVKSGLKVSQVITSEAGSQTTNYADYKTVKGVSYPHKITQFFGPQEIAFDVTELKVNEGVSDADFK
jgi:zinc protease